MQQRHLVRGPPRLREPFNAITHMVGAAIALVGGVGLVAAAHDDPWKMVSFAVYVLASLMLFSASALLHGVRAGPTLAEWLRRADHAAIFVLIAGSYTPIALVTLRVHAPGWTWPLLTTVWAFAVLGVLFKLFWFRAPRWLSTALYLVLGWMALVAIRPIAQAIPWGGIALLAGGGLLYSVGAVVYAFKRPDPAPATIGYHGLWHLFVLAGWGAHFALMAAYVLPS